MTTLANFPLISQQTKISADGSSPNSNMDCVPTSLLAGIMFLKGIASLSAEYNPDKLLDMAYPEGYKGGTEAAHFVQACASLSIKLFPFDGQPADLVKEIHKQIQEGHPCVVTVPDIYVPASYGWTHVLCMYGEDSTHGTLTALDPWPGKPTTKSGAEWEQLLQFNQIWILERIGGNSMGVPAGWTDSNGVLVSPANKQGEPDVHTTGPFRDYILANAWPNGNVALEEGHHVDVIEHSNTNLGPGFVQTFRYARLIKPDSGVLGGKVIFSWFGIEFLWLQSQVASLTTQLQQAQAQIATEQEQVKSLQAELASHPDITALSNRLSAIGLNAKQAETYLSQVQELAAQPIQ